MIKWARKISCEPAILMQNCSIATSGSDLLSTLQNKTIVEFEQPIGDVDTEIRVDPDQVGIEGRMVDFR